MVVSTTLKSLGDRIRSLRFRAPAVMLCASSVLLVAVPAQAQAQAQRKPPPAADRTRAADLFTKGAEAYRAGDFRTSVTLLEQAYAIDPQPVMIYNLARALEGLGDFEGAVEKYTQYLALDPTTRDRGAIETRIATLKQTIAERADLEKQRDAERLRAEEEARERARQEERAAHEEAERKKAEAEAGSAKKRSVLPYVVGGVGIAGVATGAVFRILASSTHADAVSESTQTTAADLQNKAQGYATISTVAFIAGGVLVATGVTWWFLDGRAKRSKTVGAALGVGPGFVTVGGAFP